MAFYDFYVSVLDSQDRVWDILLNDRIVSASGDTSPEIPAEQIIIGCEIEIQENPDQFLYNIDSRDNIPLTNDPRIYQNEATNRGPVAAISNAEYYQFNRIPQIVEIQRGIVRPWVTSSEYQAPIESRITQNPDIVKIEKNQGYEVFSIHDQMLPQYDETVVGSEPPKNSPQQEQENFDRRKNRCDECGVWVINVSQHKRCVHDFANDQVCPDCSSVFSNRLKLLMHKYYKHVPPRYKCEICLKPVR